MFVCTEVDLFCTMWAHSTAFLSVRVFKDHDQIHDRLFDVCHFLQTIAISCNLLILQLRVSAHVETSGSERQGYVIAHDTQLGCLVTESRWSRITFHFG